MFTQHRIVSSTYKLLCNMIFSLENCNISRSKEKTFVVRFAGALAVWLCGCIWMAIAGNELHRYRGFTFHPIEDTACTVLLLTGPYSIPQLARRATPYDTDRTH